MASTGLEGPFILSDVEINSIVTKISPGAYALGYVKNDGTFVVLYVGRSDSDLNARLCSWVGENKKYTHFKASYFPSAKAAFDKECLIYHDFGGPENQLDNAMHPDRPKNQICTCSRCYIFD